jgi:hypothetical protein
LEEQKQQYALLEQRTASTVASLESELGSAIVLNKRYEREIEEQKAIISQVDALKKELQDAQEAKDRLCGKASV